MFGISPLGWIHTLSRLHREQPAVLWPGRGDGGGRMT